MLRISIRFLLEVLHSNAGICFDANSVLIAKVYNVCDVARNWNQNLKSEFNLLFISHNVAEVADRIAEEYLKDGKSILSKHVGSGVEAVLMTNFNSQFAYAARKESRLPAGAEGSNQVRRIGEPKEPKGVRRNSA